MYDFHTHLNHPDLFVHREEHIKHFLEQGGQGLINVGASEEYNQNARIIAQQVKLRNIPCDVQATYGFHPYEIIRASQDENAPPKETLIQQLTTFFSSSEEHNVGIGECGIDLHYPGAKATIKDQQELFEAHVQQAKKVGLPVVIHSRDGFDETLEVLDSHYRRTHSSALYFHCRGYGPMEIERIVQKFPSCLIGFDGNITYDSAEALQASYEICPLDNIVPETDAPYLTPIAHRGKKNTPAYLSEVYNYILKVKNITPQTFDDHVEKLWHRFWRI